MPTVAVHDAVTERSLDVYVDIEKVVTRDGISMAAGNITVDRPRKLKGCRRWPGGREAYRSSAGETPAPNRQDDPRACVAMIERDVLYACAFAASTMTAPTTAYARQAV